MRKIIKKILIGAVATLIIGIVLTGISFIPTLSLKTRNMSELKGSWVNLYYETEEAAAKDVFNLAEENSKQLAQKLGFSEKQDINIYVYDNQSTFQTKKYGMIGPFLGLDWYIGDNRGTNVLLTSPARPGAVHDYENNKEASVHEIVHAYNSIINPKMQLWLNEGVATYLTNGNPPCNLYDCYRTGVPKFKQLQTKNPIEFSNMGGYDFACTYIEYLDRTYGWNNILALIETSDYEKTFKKSFENIYNEWVDFLKSNYSSNSACNVYYNIDTEV